METMSEFIENREYGVGVPLTLDTNGLELLDRIQARFERFHQEHPEVFRGLVDLAREARSRGHKTYSMAAIWEVYRWQHHNSTGKRRGTQLNNDYRSRYARKIMADIPELKGFFEIRVLGA